MRHQGLLHPELAAVLTSIGHGQTIVIADAGLPIPPDVARIDLALVPGIPAFLDTLRAILAEFRVESAIVAEEFARVSPALYTPAIHELGGLPLATVPHEEFKRLCRDAIAVVRTGECTPYANIVLVAGVTF